MSVHLTDGNPLDRLGLVPGQHEHLRVDGLTQEAFVASVKDLIFISTVGQPAMATYLSELLERAVDCNAQPTEMRTDDTLYAISLMGQFTQGDEPDVEQIRGAQKCFYRVTYDGLIATMIIPISPRYSTWW